MEDASADPNLVFFRRGFMEMQEAMAVTQKQLAALRRRAGLIGIETMGVTTTSEADERWS